MKIFVAEDEQRARIGLCRLIESCAPEHELIGMASNGRDALERIMLLKPDVAFTDIKMSFLDGLSLIKEVRDRGGEVEFVIVSAYADFDFAREAISLGVNDYLLKPVVREELLKTLEKLEDKLANRGDNRSKRKSSLKDLYPNVHPMIAKALEFIESSYSEHISQKELAAEVGLSPEYFSYLFAREVGEKFSIFLRNYRIEQAKELYRTGECDRKDVPYAVGFTDLKYFSKVFNSVTGTSLSQYLDKLENHNG